MSEQRIAPVHPSEVLLKDFLKLMSISPYRLARSIGVPVRRIHDLLHGRRAITADIALRLGRFFAMEAQFWMNLQTRYDLERAADDWPDDSIARSSRTRPKSRSFVPLRGKSESALLGPRVTAAIWRAAAAAVE